MNSSFIGKIYRATLVKLLFKIDPEKVHNSFVSLGRILGSNRLFRFFLKFIFNYEDPTLKQTVAGLEFENPLGLAAGFDKNADLINVFPNIGFAFMEVGTVTDMSYKGNPGVRLYRLPKSKGIVVYYGLKNIGATKIIEKMRGVTESSDKKFLYAVSVGKSNNEKTADTQNALEDYADCYEKFKNANLNDFYVINISCPNTFGGEPFTTEEKLDLLLKKLTKIRDKKPIFLKMPINLKWFDFKKLLDVAVLNKIEGVIIGNLNKDHSSPLLKERIPENISGGISGKPTWELSNDLIARTYKKFGKQLVIIGVGGIFNAGDAYHKIKLGASLVELVTGMIYEGPQIASDINRELVDMLKKDGYKNISEAVGTLS